jgi:hypothetical protein
VTAFAPKAVIGTIPDYAGASSLDSTFESQLALIEGLG